MIKSTEMVNNNKKLVNKQSCWKKNCTAKYEVIEKKASYKLSCVGVLMSCREIENFQ